MSLQSSETSASAGRTGKHLTVALDGIRFSDPDAAALQPSVWVEAFRVAVANGRGVSHDVRNCIQENFGKPD